MDGLEAARPVREPWEERFRDGCAFVEGSHVAMSEARVPITDWGFTRSDATYDTLHVWRGRFFRPDAHLDRFCRNVGRLRLDSLPVDRAGIAAAMYGCVARTGLARASVRLVAARGGPPPGVRDPRQCRNRFYAYAVPFIWIFPPDRQEAGCDVVVSAVERIRPAADDPTVKNFHWGDLTRGLFEAYDRGAETALLLDGEGNLTEGPGFNVFVVKDGVLATPDAGVLDGITRTSVLELAAGLNARVEVRRVRREELAAADEVFLSSSGGGVLPIVQVDDRIFGNGAIGPVAEKLAALYWDWTRRDSHRTAIPYDG